MQLLPCFFETLEDLIDGLLLFRTPVIQAFKTAKLGVKVLLELSVGLSLLRRDPRLATLLVQPSVEN